MNNNNAAPFPLPPQPLASVAEIADHITVAELEAENRPIFTNEQTGEDLILAGVETVPCLLEPILPKVGLVCLAGSSDVGKSSFLRQLAISIVTSEDKFLGFDIQAQHHSVIYVSTEDDQTALSYLLYRQNKTRQLAPECYRGLRFVFDTHDLLNELDRRLSENPADALLIDAYGDLYTKAMNEANQVRGFLHDFSQLAQKHKCLVLFLHHTGKRTDDSLPSKHNLIGSQGFEAKMRLVMELRTDLNDKTRRHLCIVKGNYLPPKYKGESYVLEFGDDQIFKLTEERLAFEALVRTDNDKEDLALFEQLSELVADKMSQNKAAESLGIPKAKASRLMKRFKPVLNETPETPPETLLF